MGQSYKRAVSSRRSQRTRKRRRWSWSEGEVRIYYESDGQFETSVYSLESAARHCHVNEFLPIFHWSHQAGEDGSDTGWNMTVRLPRVFLRTLPGVVGGKKEYENGCGEGGSCCSEASHQRPSTFAKAGWAPGGSYLDHQAETGSSAPPLLTATTAMPPAFMEKIKNNASFQRRGSEQQQYIQTYGSM